MTKTLNKNIFVAKNIVEIQKIPTSFGSKTVSHAKSPSTDSIKINRPGHNIRMFWTNFWPPTVHTQQNIFEKTLAEVCSSNLYASFGTFCIHIGQLFKYSEEFRNRRNFPSVTMNCRFSNILQRLTVSPMIDQFWRKRCQKKRKDVDYKLL